MKSDSEKIFENYARHYALGAGGIDRVPLDQDRLIRDRVPRCMAGVTTQARILDAGCAQGHLLAILDRAGYSNLSGVDISPALLKQARQIVPSSTVLQESDIKAFLANQPDGAFDIIFFHDVLEHIPREETIGLLKQFHRVLAKGGILSIRVPNMASLLASYNAHLDFTHVTQFTEFALMQVLEEAGFEVGEIGHESQAPKLFWSWRRPHRAFLRLLNRLRWSTNNGIHQLVYRFSDVFPMPSVFDFNLMIIARK